MLARNNRPVPRFNVERIAADMAVQNLNALALAKRCGKSAWTISKFLRGETQTAKTAAAIAEALGYSVRRYFAGIDRTAA